MHTAKTIRRQLSPARCGRLLAPTNEFWAHTDPDAPLHLALAGQASPSAVGVAGAFAPPEGASSKRSAFAQFVVIPNVWLDVLDAIPGRHAHRLMLRLMRISWQLKRPTFKVRNCPD